MGNPVRDVGGFEARYGIGSALDKAEWDQYLGTHRQLVTQLWNEINSLGRPPADQQGMDSGISVGPITMQGVTQGPLNQRPAGMQELLGQAQFWGIPDPEKMNPQDLYNLIQKARTGEARPAEGDFGTFGAGLAGGYFGASESLAKVTSNLAGLVGKIPFAGPTLAKVLHTEQAKQWLYDTQRGLESWAEWSRAQQPQDAQTAADVAIATGKVAGYALPAYLAWEGMGAAGASDILAPWSARISSPFLRAAIQGAASSSILELGSDDTNEQKALNIGLGAVFGFSTALPKVGQMLGFGALGSGIGAQIGSTPEERSRNAEIFGVASALLPLAPLFLRSAIRVRTDFSGPQDANVSTAVAEQPMGYQGPRRPVQAQGRVVGQPGIQGGPDYQVEPAGALPSTPADMQRLLVRSEPPTTPDQVIAQGTPAVQGPPDLLRLMSPERAFDTNTLYRLEDRAQLGNVPAPDGSYPSYVVSPAQEAQTMRDQLFGRPPQRIIGSVGGPAHPDTPVALEGTKVVDANGAPLTVYHGTGTDFEAFDPSKVDPDALYGPGFYHTEDPQIAAGYALGGSPAYLSAIGVEPEGAQIKPARLNIQNPFDVDAPLDKSKTNRLLDLTEAVLGPQPGLDYVRQGLNASDSPYSTNEHIYDTLVNIVHDVKSNLVYQGPRREIGFWLQPPISQSVTDKEALTMLLRQAGYDGITHIGGAITGSPPHRVWIAFDPGQVHSPWSTPDLSREDAIASAQAMTKQATIMESQTLPIDVNKTQLTDQDVTNALQAANPAGVSVIKGIDPTKWGEGTLRNFLEGVKGGQVTFVAQGSKLDALVGQVDPIHVDQYKKYGIFQGQRVTTTTGLEGTILNPSTAKGKVVIARQSGPPMTFNREKILPSRYSAPQITVPDLWNSFKADVLNYFNEETSKAGTPPVDTIFDPRAAGLLHDRMYNFFDRMGINEPAVRQALDENFTRNYALEAKNLDPEMRDLQASILDQAVQAHNAVEESNRPIPVSLEEAAQSKGFVWVSNPGDGGAFHDTVNPGTPSIPVETDQAATDFLANVDRSLPDITPGSDTPLEVADFAPTETNLEPRLTPEDAEDSIQQTLSHFNQVSDPGYGALGAGGAPPGLPPGPPVGGGGGALPPGQYNMGPVPPEPPTLGGQFKELQGHDPVRYANLVEHFKNSVMMRLHYTRYGMLHMENKLTDEGITLGRAWDMWNDLEVARTRAHTEALPWLNRWGDILKAYPRRVMRDGTAARIHEIEDPNARYAAFYRLAETHGYNQAQIQRVVKADDQVTQFMHDFGTYLSGDPAYDMSMDRMIFRYLPHVRARQASNAPDPYDTNFLPSEIQFFGEHAREGGLQARIMDLRDLGQYMVRAAMAKKHEAEPWAALTDAWQDPRIPEDIRNYVLDSARMIRYGYDARGELAVRGVKSVMSKFGMPVSTREAQHLLGIPQGAMYMSLLAGRASIFFRDAIQPLMTLTKVPLGTLQGVYQDVLRGGKTGILDMYQRGLEGGWIQKENPNIENVGLFEQDAMTNQDLAGITPAQAAMRERVARVGDVMAGLPDWLVRPSKSPANTLRWYAKLGQTNRMIAGETGYRWAKQNLDMYRQSTIEAAIAGDPNQAITYDIMADKANFSSFEKPIQRKLRELVSSGDDEGAAQLFGRELANFTQFRYGRSEMPPALRGTVGRMLFSFSNFTGQFGEVLNSIARNGTPRQKARAAMAISGVGLALYGLKAETGWSFDKWVWGQAFQYTGGPLLEQAVRGAAAYMGAVGSVSNDRSVPSYQQEAMKSIGNLSPADALAQYFPYYGYARTAMEYGAAAQGANPIEQAARFTITGDRGSRIDVQRMLEQEGIKQGQLSPNGGQMPASPRVESYPPGAGYNFPKANPGGGFTP